MRRSSARNAGLAGIAAIVVGLSASCENDSDRTAAPESEQLFRIEVPDEAGYVGSSYQLRLRLLDGSNTLVDPESVHWATSRDSVASVSAQGVLTCHAAGEVTVSALSENLGPAMSVQFEVLSVPPGPLGSVQFPDGTAVDFGTTTAITIGGASSVSVDGTFQYRTSPDGNEVLSTLVNGAGEPLLLGLFEETEPSPVLSSESTAIALCLLNPARAPLPLEGRVALRERVPDHPEFQSLISAIEAAIRSDPATPLAPDVHSAPYQLAASISDQLIEDLVRPEAVPTRSMLPERPLLPLDDGPRWESLPALRDAADSKCEDDESFQVVNPGYHWYRIVISEPGEADAIHLLPRDSFGITSWGSPEIAARGPLDGAFTVAAIPARTVQFVDHAIAALSLLLGSHAPPSDVPRSRLEAASETFPATLVYQGVNLTVAAYDQAPEGLQLFRAMGAFCTHVASNPAAYAEWAVEIGLLSSSLDARLARIAAETLSGLLSFASRVAGVTDLVLALAETVRSPATLTEEFAQVKGELAYREDVSTLTITVVNPSGQHLDSNGIINRDCPDDPSMEFRGAPIATMVWNGEVTLDLDLSPGSVPFDPCDDDTSVSTTVSSPNEPWTVLIGGEPHVAATSPATWHRLNAEDWTISETSLKCIEDVWLHHDQYGTFPLSQEPIAGTPGLYSVSRPWLDTRGLHPSLSGWVLNLETSRGVTQRPVIVEGRPELTSFAGSVVAGAPTELQLTGFDLWDITRVAFERVDGQGDPIPPVADVVWTGAESGESATINFIAPHELECAAYDMRLLCAGWEGAEAALLVNCEPSVESVSPLFQVGTIGTPLPHPPTVRVTDRRTGAPIQGVEVAWSIEPSSWYDFFDAWPIVSPTRSMSDSNGIASTTWTIYEACERGTGVARNVLFAEVAGVPTQRVEFQAGDGHIDFGAAVQLPVEGTIAVTIDGAASITVSVPSDPTRVLHAALPELPQRNYTGRIVLDLHAIDLPGDVVREVTVGGGCGAFLIVKDGNAAWGQRWPWPGDQSTIEFELTLPLNVPRPR